ncbi:MULTISPECIES: sensor histidine kinase KdpD [unclassified Fusibacter]|uniref:sensor histidine kinase n=1 Tax=unclassified Fusibacter TaxID=2624464 RepID=UPI0013E909C0|nr:MULTISPECIES: HAMP domain-containing sensor histidine kinase [unclassified Fusibacter]MCK8059898.1 HAMP domain-containing histidine kinase [Fusibacter sp. A2]NPE23896.1 HAMP domain-containing histidine kinase [Fusibacter sp. A1]
MNKKVGTVFFVFMAITVAVSFGLTFNRGLNVSLEELNGIANDIENELRHNRANVSSTIHEYKLMYEIDFKLLGANGNTLYGTGVLADVPKRYGYYTKGKYWYYTLPILNDEKVERLVIFDNERLMGTRDNSVTKLMYMLWVGLLLFGYGIGFYNQTRNVEFIGRLNKMTEGTRTAGNNKTPKNVNERNQYVLDIIKEYEDKMQDTAYTTTVEQTKQDERMKNMMHDMKTPIAALHAFVEAYNDGLYSPDKLPSKMGLIERNMNHLMELIRQYDSFIAYSKGQMNVNMRKVSMKSLVDQILIGIERDFALLGRSIRLVVSEQDFFLVCDMTEIQKLLNILVENAHKYSEINKPIILSAIVRAQTLQIIVKDYGMGISRNKQESVFDPFVKGDEARTSSNQSYGIGLYIAKQIVHRHGGEITLESVPGSGTSFTVVLPIKES